MDNETPFDILTSPDDILEDFHCHQSFLKIQEAFNTSDKFSFYEIMEDKF